MNPIVLIEEVKRYPCLWQTDHPRYKNNIYKAKCWEVIAEKLKKNVATVKKEWKYLRDGLRQAMQAKRFHVGENKYQRSWHLENRMEFLKPFLNTNRWSRKSCGYADRIQRLGRVSGFASDDMQFVPVDQCSRSSPSHSHSQDNTKSSMTLSYSAEVGTSTPDEDANTEHIEQQSTDEIASEQYSPPEPNSTEVDWRSSGTILSGSDTLELFFKTMHESTRRLPLRSQIRLKRKIAELVFTEEETASSARVAAAIQPTPASMPDGRSIYRIGICEYSYVD